MNPETPRTHRPRVRCARCGSADVNTSFHAEVLPFGTGAKSAQLHVSIPVRTCASCGSTFTDHETETIRHEAVCRHMRVLTPREIRTLRLRLGMTRRQFATLTKLGEATIARWEAGSLIQNAAYDTLLRLLMYPENVDRLRGEVQRRSVQSASNNVQAFQARFREIQEVPPDLANCAASFATTLVM
jgi:putative zinc finger/helix-turn-helix YgiT family protein